MLSCFFLCSRSLQLGDAAPGYWAHLLLIPGAELFGALPFTPGGVGTLEGAVGFCYWIANETLDLQRTEALAAGFFTALRLFFLSGVRTEAAAAGVFTALGYRVITFVIAAVGAGYYWTARREISSVLEESARTESDQATESQVTASEDLDAGTMNATKETELTEAEPKSS